MDARGSLYVCREGSLKEHVPARGIAALEEARARQESEGAAARRAVAGGAAGRRSRHASLHLQIARALEQVEIVFVLELLTT